MYHDASKDKTDKTYPGDICANNYFAVCLNNKGMISFVGDSTYYNAMETDSWSDIKKIYCNRGSRFLLGLKTDGTVVVAGDSAIVSAFKTTVEAWTDIVDLLPINPSNIIGLKADGQTVLAGKTNRNLLSDVKKISAICDTTADYSSCIFMKNDNKPYSYLGYTIANWDLHDVSGDADYPICVSTTGDFRCTDSTIGAKAVVQREVSLWGKLKKAILAEKSSGSTTYVTIVGLKTDGTVKCYTSFLSKGAAYTAFLEKIATWSEIVDIYTQGNFLVGFKADKSFVYAKMSNDVLIDSIVSFQPKEIFLKSPDYECPTIASTDGMIISCM